MENNSIIDQEYLDEDALMPVFQESNQIEDDRIFPLLDEVHRVALTSEYYFDDVKNYEVKDHIKCIVFLEDMTVKYSDDDVPSTLDKGDLKSLEAGTGEMKQSTVIIGNNICESTHTLTSNDHMGTSTTNSPSSILDDAVEDHGE